MNNDVQYEIFIGCADRNTKNEIVKSCELLKLVDEYFTKLKINYSALEFEGGYHQQNGSFICEKTICITIIGNQNFDIVKFSKALSMYMNQECFMITKKNLQKEYR